MEKSSFFNAVADTAGNYDRVYKAEDFADYFNKFIGNGIFYKKSDYCQITATGNDMNISENIGSAYINGYEYSNTTALTKAITVADGVLDRIDLVVLRLDYVNREIKCYVKQGQYASSPICPSLQRDADCYELGLASIYVKHGATAISQADITDLRLDSNYCGIVHGLIEQIDVTTLFNQFEAKFSEKIDANEEDFVNWFNNIKGQLSTDPAGHLQNQIDFIKNIENASVIRSDKDENGVFIKVEYKDKYETLIITSKLSEDESPLYTKRTETYADGTVNKYLITYDDDNNVVSEVRLYE